MILQAGSIVQFHYAAPKTTDREKQVLVLHPNWRGQVHALDLKRMTPAEQKVILAIMDPETKKNGSHPYPLVNDILRRMDPLEEIKNPISFFQRFVKPFIRTAGDCYRRYVPALMSNVHVARPSQMQGQQLNPNPLFRK